MICRNKHDEYHGFDKTDNPTCWNDEDSMNSPINHTLCSIGLEHIILYKHCIAGGKSYSLATRIASYETWHTAISTPFVKLDGSACLAITYSCRSCMGPLSSVDVCIFQYIKYPPTSNISCTLVDNKMADHSDVVEASSVAAASTTSSFSI